MPSTTVSSIAIDFVGQSRDTAKNLLNAYLAATRLGAHRLDAGYAKLAASPLVPTPKLKSALLDSERRSATLLVDAAERVSDRAVQAVDRAAGWTVEGLEAFAEKTAWAGELMAVEALRTVQLPVARLSLGLATKLNGASRELARRVARPKTAKAAVQAAKAPLKRARRATQKAA
jgi:hypothetical protein